MNDMKLPFYDKLKHARPRQSDAPQFPPLKVTAS